MKSNCYHSSLLLMHNAFKVELAFHEEIEAPHINAYHLMLGLNNSDAKYIIIIAHIIRDSTQLNVALTNALPLRIAKSIVSSLHSLYYIIRQVTLNYMKPL